MKVAGGGFGISAKERFDPAVLSSSSVGKLLATPTVLLAWTLGRLWLVPMIVVGFFLSPWFCAVSLVCFVAADLYDGILARDLNADDPARRALDSIVDRLSIWMVLGAVSAAGFLSPVLLALLVARDVYCAYLCYRMIRFQNVAIKPDWHHRSLNLALAGWVIAAPLLDGMWRSVAFTLILGFGVFVAVDLRRCIGSVVADPISFRNMVVPAKGLRAR